MLNAKIDIGPGILWREIIGNGFGLASAILGMRRKVAAWPIGIVGNILLFTVFLGGVFHTPQDLDLWGQAGRQVFFLIVSVYGWVPLVPVPQVRRGRGREVSASSPAGRAEGPPPAGGRGRRAVDRLLLRLKALGSWGPAADAWILTGSILATYGMARGWVEFWLIWIAVDLVGVPLLLHRRLLPVGDHVHRLRRVLRDRLHLLVADRAPGPGRGEPVAVDSPEIETVG